MSDPRTADAAPTWWAHGLTNLIIVLALTFGGWYLLNDPSTSPLDVYPLPFNAALFWALLFVVWSGFNLEFAGFTRLAQPLRGLTITAATAIFAIAVTWALSSGVGHFYPDFAASRDGGTGYFTGALFVLFGFSTYVLVVINWAHWPWPDLGLRQPLVGLCEIAFLLMPTTLLWVVLGIPAVSETVRAGSPLLDMNTLLGWYYSIIVAIVLTGLTMENWPWRLAPRPRCGSARCPPAWRSPSRTRPPPTVRGQPASGSPRCGNARPSSAAPSSPDRLVPGAGSRPSCRWPRTHELGQLREHRDSRPGSRIEKPYTVRGEPQLCPENQQR